MGGVKRTATVDIMITIACLRPHVFECTITAFRRVGATAFIPEIGKGRPVNTRLQSPGQAMVCKSFQLAEIPSCTIIQHHIPKRIQVDEGRLPYPETRQAVGKEVSHLYHFIVGNMVL